MLQTVLKRLLAGLTTLCLLLSLVCVPVVAAGPLEINSHTALTTDLLAEYDAVNITGGATQEAAVAVTLDGVDASAAPITTTPDTYTDLTITGAAAQADVTITSLYDRVWVDKAALDAGNVKIHSDIPSVWTVTKANGDKIYYGSNAYAVLRNDAYAANNSTFEFRFVLDETTTGGTAYDVWKTGAKHLVYDLYLYTTSVGTRFADYSMTVDTALLGTPEVDVNTAVFGADGEYGGVRADGNTLRVTYFNAENNGLIGQADGGNPNGVKLASLNFALAAGCERVDDVLVLGSGSGETAPVTEAGGDMVTSPSYSEYATTGVSFTQAYTLYDLEISYKNGGVGSPEDAFYGNMTGFPTHYSYTENAVTLPTEVTATGYQFNGWYGTVTAPGDATYLTSLDTTDKTSKTVYAIWSPFTYKIVYDLGGGDALTGEPTSYTSGETVALPTPTRTGYDFAGWYSAAAGGTLFADGKLTASNFSAGLTTYESVLEGFSGEIKVFARWTAKQYPITYRDKNSQTDFSGTNSDALVKTHTYGADTVLVSPERTGYSLAGLYTNFAGTEALTKNTETGKYYLAATGYTAPVTLYADWTIKQYTITFNSKGGSAVTAITQDYATAVTAPTAPTRTGYEFAGWYLAEDYTGGKYSFTTMPAEDITLFAKWTPVSSALTGNTTYQDANTSVTAEKASLTFYSDAAMETSITAAPTASTVYVKATPADGYAVSTVTVGGSSVTLTRQPDGSYTGSFTMPESAPAIAVATHADIEIAYFVTTDNGASFFKPFSAYGPQTLIMLSYSDGLSLQLNGLPVYTVSGQYVVNGTGIRSNKTGEDAFVSKAVTLSDLSLTSVAGQCESPSTVAAYLWRFAELSAAPADGSMSYPVTARQNGGYDYDASAVTFTANAAGGYQIGDVALTEINGYYDIAKGNPLNATPEMRAMLAGDLAKAGAAAAVEIGQDGQLTVADVLLLIAAYQAKYPNP